MANKSTELLPSSTLKIESTGQELKMSYGMYSDIMRLVGDPQSATALLIQDATTRDLVIRRLFTDNKKAVNETSELIDSFEIEILPTEIDAIISWVADHISYFLLSTGKKMNVVMDKYREQLNDQQSEPASSSPSKTGSES